MKLLKKIFKWFLVILIALNLAIIVTGKTYLYKGVWNTYLKGRSGPGVDEYQIFANREVKAGNYQAWPIGKDYNRSVIPAKYKAEFSRLGTISFLIIKDDSLRYEEYWDGGGENSITNSFSASKTFVGILTGVAIREGKIKSLDQPVGDFLPAFKEGDNAKLTIRHLLTMSSGINFDEDYVSPFAYPAQAYYGSDLEDLTNGYKVTAQPGKVFKYLSGNTALLSFVLKKATGQSLSDYASEKLWKPMGAKNSAFWSLDHENGVEKAYCCFNSNARDFARFGKLYLDSGRWNGAQLVPEDFVLQSVRPSKLMDESGKPDDSYGYAWWLLKHKGLDAFYARGILGQYIIVIPAENMVIVRLGKKRDKVEGDAHPRDVYTWIDAALEMY
jgi:CubicO group peptidase (beta-lactamase class C family)